MKKSFPAANASFKQAFDSVDSYGSAKPAPIPARPSRAKAAKTPTTGHKKGGY